MASLCSPATRLSFLEDSAVPASGMVSGGMIRWGSTLCMLLLPSQGNTRPIRWSSPGGHPHSAPLNISPPQTNLGGSSPPLLLPPTQLQHSAPGCTCGVRKWLCQCLNLGKPALHQHSCSASSSSWVHVPGGKGWIDRNILHPWAQTRATPGTCPCCSHTTLLPSSAAFFMDQVLGHSFGIHSPVLWGQVPSGHRQKTRKFGEEPQESLGLEGEFLNESGPGSP